MAPYQFPYPPMHPTQYAAQPQQQSLMQQKLNSLLLPHQLKTAEVKPVEAKPLQAPVEGAPADERIAKLRDQLRLYNRAERPAAEPEAPRPATRNDDDMQREWLMQQNVEQSVMTSRLVQQFARNELPPPPSQVVMQNAFRISSENADIMQMRCVVIMPSVPNKFCSAIIGQRGGNVRDLQRVTGAKVQVQNDGMGRGEPKDIAISGEVQNVHGALMTICDMMCRIDMGMNPEDGVLSSSAVGQWLSSFSSAGGEEPLMKKRR